MRSLWNSIALAICLIGLPAPHYAQEPDALLTKAASALRSSGVKTVRFVAAGSGYEVGPTADRSTWRHIRIDRELRELDIEHLTLRKGDRVIDTNSPWQDQVEIWSMPEAFLKVAKPANIVGEWQQGQALYSLVIFNVGNNSITGYFNNQNLLEIVEAHIQHPTLGDTVVQWVYSDYKDFGGIKRPATIIQKLGGALVSVVVVSDVQVR